MPRMVKLRTATLRMIAICLLIAVVGGVIQPGMAWAANWGFGLNLLRGDDGIVRGELWLNDRLVWRLELLSDAAEPVSLPEARAPVTTLVIPDMVDGMLVLRFAQR